MNKHDRGTIHEIILATQNYIKDNLETIEKNNHPHGQINHVLKCIHSELCFLDAIIKEVK